MSEIGYKVTGMRDFNDLIVDRIMFVKPHVAKLLLYEMFPGAEVSTIVEPNGDYRIIVDDVKLDIKFNIDAP